VRTTRLPRMGRGTRHDVTPIGPEMRSTGKPAPMTARPTPEQLIQDAGRHSFSESKTITSAAQGCDIIVGATALPARRSLHRREAGHPYFSPPMPAVLPSPHHAPPLLPCRRQAGNKERATASCGKKGCATLEMFSGETYLNSYRTKTRIGRVSDGTPPHFDRPAVAGVRSDLGPWPESRRPVRVPDRSLDPAGRSPPSPELEAFLDAARTRHVYFGFGSIKAPAGSQVMIQSARALGRRVIISGVGRT